MVSHNAQSAIQKFGERKREREFVYILIPRPVAFKNEMIPFGIDLLEIKLWPPASANKR